MSVAEIVSMSTLRLGYFCSRISITQTAPHASSPSVVGVLQESVVSSRDVSQGSPSISTSLGESTGLARGVLPKVDSFAEPMLGALVLGCNMKCEGMNVSREIFLSDKLQEIFVPSFFFQLEAPLVYSHDMDLTGSLQGGDL